MQDRNGITFNAELARKTIHISNLVIPYSIYFLLGHAKFSFLNYQSMASTDSSSGCCKASAHLVTQMLSVSYQDVIQNFGDAKIYYSAGIGTLQSVGIMEMTSAPALRCSNFARKSPSSTITFLLGSLSLLAF